MVKKLVILGFILTVFAAAGHGMGRDIYGRYSGSSADGNAGGSSCMCWSGLCPPPVMPKVKAKPQKLTTSIEVKMQYPAPPPMMPCGPMMAGCGAPPPIPVAVPMWKFIVPWPPFVYYLPVSNGKPKSDKGRAPFRGLFSFLCQPLIVTRFAMSRTHLRSYVSKIVMNSQE